MLCWVEHRACLCAAASVNTSHRAGDSVRCCEFGVKPTSRSSLRRTCPDVVLGECSGERVSDLCLAHACHLRLDTLHCSPFRTSDLPVAATSIFVLMAQNKKISCVSEVGHLDIGSELNIGSNELSAIERATRCQLPADTLPLMESLMFICSPTAKVIEERHRSVEPLLPVSALLAAGHSESQVRRSVEERVFGQRRRHRRLAAHLQCLLYKLYAVWTRPGSALAVQAQIVTTTSRLIRKRVRALSTGDAKCTMQRAWHTQPHRPQVRTWLFIEAQFEI